MSDAGYATSHRTQLGSFTSKLCQYDRTASLAREKEGKKKGREDIYLPLSE